MPAETKRNQYGTAEQRAAYWEQEAKSWEELWDELHEEMEELRKALGEAQTLAGHQDEKIGWLTTQRDGARAVILLESLTANTAIAEAEQLRNRMSVLTGEEPS